MTRLDFIILDVALILGATVALARPGTDDPCVAVKGSCEFFEGPETIITRLGVIVVDPPDTRGRLAQEAREVLDRWLQPDRDPMRRVVEGRPSLDKEPVSGDASNPRFLAHDDPGGW